MYLRITSSYNFDLFVKKIIEEDWNPYQKKLEKYRIIGKNIIINYNIE